MLCPFLSAIWWSLHSILLSLQNIKSRFFFDILFGIKSNPYTCMRLTSNKSCVISCGFKHSFWIYLLFQCFPRYDAWGNKKRRFWHSTHCLNPTIPFLNTVGESSRSAKSDPWLSNSLVWSRVSNISTFQCILHIHVIRYAHGSCMRRHVMETPSGLLAFCERNLPVTGGFPRRIILIDHIYSS